MKAIKFFIGFAMVMCAINFSANAQPTAFDENNQERAIGLASSAVADCLAQARKDGYTITAVARGEQDENGELTNWGVVFFGTQSCCPNYPIRIAGVRIEGWDVVSEECYARPR